jgi:polyhydroxybutyrate depolymerase
MFQWPTDGESVIKFTLRSRRLPGTIIAIVIAGFAVADDTVGERIGSVTVNGVERTWRMYVPPDHEEGGLRPLVLDFHGTGSNPESQARLSRFESLAAEVGLLVATPQAKYPRKRDGRVTWNVDLHQDAVDDVRFIRAMIGQIRGQYPVDPKRIYATGFSGGGRMSSRLACDLSDVFAAIGPVAGIRYPEDCKPLRPVPVITFHGKEDGINHYEHRADSADYWRMGVEEAIAGWARNNGCAGKASEERITSTVVRVAYQECERGGDIVFYRSEDAGHTWPGSPEANAMAARGRGKTNSAIDASKLIWQFFEAHLLP